MAYEGFFYWKGWADYLEAPDESGLAQVHAVRARSCSRARPATTTRCCPTTTASACRTRCGTPRRSSRRCRSSTCTSSGRRRAPPTTTSPRRARRSCRARSTRPTPATSTTRRSRRTTSSAPPRPRAAQFIYRRKVTEIRQAGGKVLGVTLDDGSEIDAGIVVNVAGPHSFVINRMAGVEDGMKIKTKALRHEVHHVPSPPGFDYEKDGHHVSDGDNAIYFRPETRQPHPDRLRGSGLRPAGVGREPRRLQPPGHARAVGGAGLPLRPPHPDAADPGGDEGRRRPLRLLRRLDPDLRQERPRRLLHGGRHERQPVQERPRSSATAWPS